METVDQRKIRSKAFSIKSLMNNPKTAKILVDSWDSPLGSTKKTRAKGVMNSLKKSMQNYYYADGMGGPGIENPLQNVSITPTTTPTVTPLNTSNKPTKFIKSIDSFLESRLGQGLLALGETTLTGPTGVLSKIKSTVSGLEKFGETLGKGPSEIFKSGASLLAYPYEYLSQKPGTKTEYGFPKTPTAQAKTTAPSAASTTTEGKFDISKIPTGQYTPAPTSTTTIPTGETLDLSTTEGLDQLSQMGAPELQQWYSSLDPSMQDYYKDIYNAVSSGVGPETWAMQAMTNKDTLKKLGLTDEAIALLPTETGLISQQIIDLQNNINKEFQLDTQLNRLLDLKQRGLTIENDLTNYISGKDEYLGKVDKLLDDAKSRIAYMDTSNPYVAQRMQNYVNYLTILQGRQNQRYINFLDMAVDYSNAEYQQSTDLYNTSLAEAKQKFEQQGSITAESYANVKEMLKDIYNNVEKRTETLREAEKWEYEKAKTLAEIDVLVAKSQESQIKPVSDFTDLDQVFGLMDTENKTFSFTTYSPYEVLSGATAAGLNAETALTRFFNRSQMNLKDQVTNGNFLNEVNKYKDNILNAEEINAADPKSKDYIQNINSNMTSTIETGLREGIKNMLASDATKIDDVRDAILELVNKGYKIGNIDKNNFVGKYSGSIGDLSEILYDDYTNAASIIGDKDQVNEIFKSVKENTKSMGDSDLINFISKDVIDYVLGS